MKCTCKKCGYTWESRTDTKPKSCPACKSYRWDKEPIKKHIEATDRRRQQ